MTLPPYFPPSQHIEDMPTHAKERQAAQGCSDTFTSLVGMYRNSFPNPEIRVLGDLLWNLVGNNMVSTAAAEVPAPAFMADETTGAVILLPFDFGDRMHDERFVMATCSVMSVGSRSRDYYNERLFDDSTNSDMRAYCYEAEVLLQMTADLKKTGKSLLLNKYQEQILQKAPLGLKSMPPGVQYVSKPFVLGKQSGFYKEPHSVELN